MPVNWLTPGEDNLKPDELEAAAARFLAKAAELRAMSKLEPQQDGSVIRWRIGGLTYIAIKCRDHWWTTGRTGGQPWADLFEYPPIRDGKFEVVSTWYKPSV